MCNRSAQYFTDTDLFGAPVSSIDHQSQQTKATDKYGQARGPGQQARYLLLAMVKTCYSFVVKVVIKIIFGINVLIGFTYFIDSALPGSTIGVFGAQSNVQLIAVTACSGKYQRPYLGM